jgi:aminotransferase EvaB
MYGYVRPNYAEEPGMNGRIAELQAAILRVKLHHLPAWLKRRRAIADGYHREVHHPAIRLPHRHDEREHAYHQFVIRCQDRAQVIAALDAHAIGYGIHYPTPIHQMPPYRHLSGPLPVTERASTEILSIPIHEALTEREVDLIIAALNQAV